MRKFLCLKSGVFLFLTCQHRPQWSYKKGLAAGVLPAKPWERQYDCSGPVPDFGDLPETY